MDLTDLLKSMLVKHKVFISYYHKDDEFYRNRFEYLFGDLFINRSVKPGDINTDNSTEYIKHLIRNDYISNCSVTIVLIGPRTYCRKHVDWEIYATLDKQAKGCSGLLGLCLPTHPNYLQTTYTSSIVPERFVDNLKTKYANFYDWTENKDNIKNWVELAFNDRINKKDCIDNSRIQFSYNKCD